MNTTLITQQTSIEHGPWLQADIQRQIDTLRGKRVGGFTYFTVVEYRGRVDSIYVTCCSREDARTNAQLAHMLTGSHYQIWDETFHCFE